MKKYTFILIGIIVGMILGYVYYDFYGCDGNCMLTSSPVKSTIYGGILGGLFFDILKPIYLKIKKKF